MLASASWQCRTCSSSVCSWLFWASESSPRHPPSSSEDSEEGLCSAAARCQSRCTCCQAILFIFFKVLNKGEPKPPYFLILKPLCRDKSCSGTDVPKGPWCKWPLRVSKTLLLRVEGWQCTLQGSSNQGVGAPWKSPRTPGYCFWHQQSYRGGPAVLLNSTWLTDHFPVR